VVAVLIEDSHKILDIKSLSRVAEKLREITVRLELSLIKLLAAKFINKVSTGSGSHPAMFVDALSLFIDKEALVSLE
jgi:hypothetical protein